MFGLKKKLSEKEIADSIGIIITFFDGLTELEKSELRVSEIFVGIKQKSTIEISMKSMKMIAQLKKMLKPKYSKLVNKSFEILNEPIINSIDI